MPSWSGDVETSAIHDKWDPNQPVSTTAKQTVVMFKKTKNEQRNRKHIFSISKTDGGKTKSNAIEIPSISIPKGGGAIKGIDEKFSVNAVNGTASFSIRFLFPARGASPALNLSYNSGAGNGIFGLGWNLNLPSIKRKTDKGLPQYIDGT